MKNEMKMKITTIGMWNVKLLTFQSRADSCLNSRISLKYATNSDKLFTLIHIIYSL